MAPTTPSALADADSGDLTAPIRQIPPRSRITTSERVFAQVRRETGKE
jgi:hypothetical protein